MSLLSAQLKRSCYIVVTKKTVKTRRQPRRRKEISRGKDERIAWPEHHDVRYKNNAHIPGISLH